MKFQIVEQSRGGRLFDDHGDANNVPTEIQTSDDPIQGLKAGTTRLVSDVRAEAQQISECVAEATALAAQAAGAELRQYDRGIATRPPASFRAARFGAPAGNRPETEQPAAGAAGPADEDGRRRRP
jgi:hypothetical protein